MTTKYFTYNETTKGLVSAKRVIDRPDGSRIANPTAEQYAAIGAYPMAGNGEEGTGNGEVPEGKVAIPDGYELRDNAWHRVWRYEDAPEPPKPVYDKYKLVVALEEAGLLADFVALIKADPVMEIKWSAASRLDYDDDTLTNALAVIKETLGVTDEQVAAILKAAEI